MLLFHRIFTKDEHMQRFTGLRNILKDMMLLDVPEEHNTGMYRTAAILRLVFVFPLLYGFTLYCLLWAYGSVHTAPFPQSLAVWLALAGFNVVLNVVMLVIRDLRVCGALSVVCIADELLINEIIIYITGVAASHALIFILLSVAIYRVYFGYRQGLFAAIYGPLLHLVVVILFFSGVLPASSVQYAQSVMGELSGLLAWASSVSLVIGVMIAFFVINLCMNRLYRARRELAENWKKDLDNIERFNELVMECREELDVFTETIKAVMYATPYQKAALFEYMDGTVVVKAASGWNGLDVQAAWKDASSQLPSNNEVKTIVDSKFGGKPIHCFSLECTSGAPVYLAISGQDAEALNDHRKSMLLNISQSAGDAINTHRLIRFEKEKGYRDALTGLYNKRYLADQLPVMLRIAKDAGKPLCAAMFDIDGFKAYNDAFGHLAGDELLKRVGQAVSSALREGDAAVRFGGEEFIALLPGTEMNGGEAAAERVREAVERIDDPNRRVTVSGGVAAFPADAEAAELLIESADQRLYRAKQTGKNKILSN